MKEPSIFDHPFFRDDDDDRSRSFTDSGANERDDSRSNDFFSSNIFSSRSRRNNSYFQQDLDDNQPDDYVINGWGSLDDDE